MTYMIQDFEAQLKVGLVLQIRNKFPSFLIQQNLNQGLNGHASLGALGTDAFPKMSVVFDHSVSRESGLTVGKKQEC